MTSKQDHNPSGRSTIKNADVPSDTAGLPGTAEEASGAHYLRDTIEPTGKAETDETVRRPAPTEDGA